MNQTSAKRGLGKSDNASLPKNPLTGRREANEAKGNDKASGLPKAVPHKEVEPTANQAKPVGNFLAASQATQKQTLANQVTVVGDDLGGRPKRVPSQPRQTIPSTSQIIPVANDENDIAIGRDTPIQKVNPIKTVLKKKTMGPSARGGKKEVEMKLLRVKNVKFVAEQQAASEMVPSKPSTFKPSTKTGSREISAKDFAVILGFWSMRFFIPWIDAWHNFNFYLLREPSFWDPLEKDVQTGEMVVFSVMCVITLGLSAFADFVNFRFYIFSVLLLLFVLCPITGALFNEALVARAYDQEFYHKRSFVSDVLFHFTLAIAVVSFPIQLSCIFSQIENMSKQAHYNWAAALVLMESFNRYICFWVIPGKCPTKTFTQTAIWFFIGVVIFTVFLLTTNFFFDWAKPELMHSTWYLEKSMKYKEDNNVNMATKRQKLIWFSSMLVVLVITSAVFATLERLTPDEYWDKHSVVSATSMLHLGEVLGVGIMVAAISVIRWKLQYYCNLPCPEVLALGLPHAINAIALIALLGRFESLSHLNEGDIIIGPIPNSKKMVVEFYNFDYRNRTICVHSTSFRPVKIGPRQRGTREIYDSGLSRIHFGVTLDPQTTPGLITIDSFKYKEDTWATFIITLPISNIKFSDVQALYSKPEILRVYGTQRLRPKKEPQIFFMNTFVTNNKSSFSWMFYVKQSGFYYEFRYNLRWQTEIVEVPAGRLEIGYHLVNSTFPPQTVKTTVEADNYSVWCVLLGHARPMKKEETLPPRMIKGFKTMEVAGPNSTRLPTKAQLQRDGYIMTGMALAGMASSGIFTGMIYLFWLDTPFFVYRTTCIGVFWVLWQIPVELSKIKVVDIGKHTIAGLLVLQLLCTCLHFITATQFYKGKFNFRKQPD